jgi:preprotein translocase subunit YajC
MTNYVFIGIIIVVIILMFWWSSRSNKKRQKSVQDFKESLRKGTPIATHSGLLGTIVSIDRDRDEAVIESEGSLSKWRLAALTEPPVVPAYVSDDEVDEEGNPLTEGDEEKTDEPEDASDAATSVGEEAAEVEETVTKPVVAPEADQSTPIMK